ncbi:MAG: cytochrome c biogenesis protein ResB [Vampirovibrionales bacterium]
MSRPLAQAQAVFKRHGYHVHVNTADGQLYATKGQWSRLGPCAAHLGILICLLAGVYGSFTGFKAIHMVAPGGQFQIPSSAMFATNTPQPWWFGQIPVDQLPYAIFGWSTTKTLSRRGKLLLRPRYR